MTPTPFVSPFFGALVAGLLGSLLANLLTGSRVTAVRTNVSAERRIAQAARLYDTGLGAA